MRSSGAFDGATKLFLILDEYLVAKTVQCSGYAAGEFFVGHVEEVDDLVPHFFVTLTAFVAKGLFEGVGVPVGCLLDEGGI